jgi:hypothetical protein
MVVLFGGGCEGYESPISLPNSSNSSVTRRRRGYRSRQLESFISRTISWPVFISLFLSCVTIIVIAVVHHSPPGKNYFDASYWRTSNHVVNVDALAQLQSTFPVHVGISDFEVVVHPGYLMADKERLNFLTDGRGYFVQNLTVPQFWDPVNVFGDNMDGNMDGISNVRKFLGQGGKYLISPEEARAIGSFHNSRETIFVSIASYRDPECQRTVESIFARARYPDRIRVAIVDQRQQGSDDPICQAPSETACHHDDSNELLCKYARQIDRIEYPSQSMAGPILARHIGHRMYRGEYFVLQVDSHVRFVADWDQDIIDQWRSTGNEMAVVTTYMNDVARSIDPVTHASLQSRRAMMCSLTYEWEGDPKEHIRFQVQPTSKPRRDDSPMLHPFWAAGFSFARGHFVV